MADQEVALDERYQRALHELARQECKSPEDLGGELIRDQLRKITEPKGNTGKVQPFRRRGGPEKVPKNDRQ